MKTLGTVLVWFAGFAVGAGVMGSYYHTKLQEQKTAAQEALENAKNLDAQLDTAVGAVETCSDNLSATQRALGKSRQQVQNVADFACRYAPATHVNYLAVYSGITCVRGVK